MIQDAFIKACFQHDKTYGDFKYLPGKRASGGAVKSKIMSN